MATNNLEKCNDRIFRVSNHGGRCSCTNYRHALNELVITRSIKRISNVCVLQAETTIVFALNLCCSPCPRRPHPRRSAGSVREEPCSTPGRSPPLYDQTPSTYARLLRHGLSGFGNKYDRFPLMFQRHNPLYAPSQCSELEIHRSKEMVRFTPDEEMNPIPSFTCWGEVRRWKNSSLLSFSRASMSARA